MSKKVKLMKEKRSESVKEKAAFVKKIEMVKIEIIKKVENIKVESVENKKSSTVTRRASELKKKMAKKKKLGKFQEVDKAWADVEFSDDEGSQRKQGKDPSQECSDNKSKHEEQQALWSRVYVSGKQFLPECSGTDLDDLWWQIIEFPFTPQYADGTGLQPEAYRRMMLQNIKEELSRRDDGKREKGKAEGRKGKGKGRKK